MFKSGKMLNLSSLLFFCIIGYKVYNRCTQVNGMYISFYHGATVLMGQGLLIVEDL